MTRCWNTDDFEYALKTLFRAADRVRAVLEQFSPKATFASERKTLQERVDFWLECHARDFSIDHLLAALNWQLQPSLDPQEYVTSNLVSEQSPDAIGGIRLRGETAERRRRMDYLGYDRVTDQPLMVVEAKRPNLALPGVTPSLAAPDAHDSGRLVAAALKTLRAGTSAPQNLLNAEWREVIQQLRDYCRTVRTTRGVWPMRAVLTNGDWLIVFADPENTFGDADGDEIHTHAILVFESRDSILQHHKLIWNQIEYSALARVDRRLLITQVPFVVDPTMLKTCSFGLRVSYTVKSTNYRRAPLLSVSPVLFVGGHGAFIQVASDLDREIPVDQEGPVANHIREVQAASHQLKQAVELRVVGGRALQLISVQSHCANREALRHRPLVQSLPNPDGETFLVLTGSDAHFVLEADNYAGCLFHRFASARADGVAQQSGPLLESTLQPKSYFADGSRHHCTHKEVFAIKREPITEGNRARCGHRESAVGSAFCEVWRFEEFLCCRSCAFQPVCAEAQAHSLPCREVVPLLVNCNAVAVPATA